MYRKFNSKQIVIWISALVIGMLLGGMGMVWIKAMADFIATVYTRLFQFLAVPTIALAVGIYARISWLKGGNRAYIQADIGLYIAHYAHCCGRGLAAFYSSASGESARRYGG